MPTIDWIVAGGESGAHARPMNPAWARALRDQCAAADVPFFFKQLGEWAPCNGEELDGSEWAFPTFDVVRRVGKARAGRLLDGVTHDALPARTA